MTAWLSVPVDGVSSGSSATQFNGAGYSSITRANLFSTLHPSSTFFYTNEVPPKDGWKASFAYGYSGNPLGSQVIAIGSGGRNTDLTTLNVTATIGPFIPTKYNENIIWADGFFVRPVSPDELLPGCGVADRPSSPRSLRV